MKATRRLLLLSWCVVPAVLAVGAPPAAGSPAAEAIAAEVDIDTYQYYLEDLLYTHLGDNRGFGPEHNLARDNIVAVLSDLDLPVTLEPFQYSGQTYHNIVATQVGTDFPNRIYIVGAHFDSVNNPGADDNATGTALVMEVARVLSKHAPTKTIKYVLFDREEQGLVGSNAYVDDHAADQILMAVIADMVGHDSGQYGMDLYGKTSSSSVINGLADAIETYGDGLNAFLNFGNFAFSDHWPFESDGIPACVIIERCYSCNPHYHQMTDAVDNGVPNYIYYPMIEDLLHAVVGFLVDEVDIVRFADINEDGGVDAADLALLLGNWGPCPGCAADLNQDGEINAADLALLLGAWG